MPLARASRPGQTRHAARGATAGRQSPGPTCAADAPKFVPLATGAIITLKPPVVVRDLAEQLKKKPFQLIADLMELGVFANVNQSSTKHRSETVRQIRLPF